MFFRVVWLLDAFGVAEVGSLFPWVRASMWESCRHKAHRTGLRCAEHFSKIRSAKCARDCSESSISFKNHQKLARSEQRRICVVESALLTLCERWSIRCGAPAMPA